MILPDLNLLLYAYNPHILQHSAARDWWETVINGDELIGLPYDVSYGFIRIATNRRLGPAAVSLSVARGVVEGWLSLPQVRTLTPNPRHFARVMELMVAAMAASSASGTADTA